MKKITILTTVLLLFTYTQAQVSWSTASYNVGGDDRALVDMNNDNLDDLVGLFVSSTEQDYIQIRYQESTGGFASGVTYPITATYSSSWSLAVGDYNKDGYNDLVWGSTSGAHVATAGAGGNSYSVTNTSNTVFTQRTNFADINNDGNLDIFICDDVEPNEYFMNDGSNNLTLYEGANAAGVPEGLGIYPSGGNYGSIWIDVDNDRDNDLFIAKCGGNVARRTNELHRNNGNSSFTSIASTAGLADPINTWSSAWGDYDNDGDMDCFIGSSSSTEDHKLMRNEHDPNNPSIISFTDVSVASGVDDSSAKYYENVFIDFDNDGWQDLYVNGDILYNNGDGTFTVTDPGISNFGGAFGDANNDGFIDLFRNGTVYLNQGNSNNWIKINTKGTDCNANGIGARVELTTTAGTQIRDVRSGEGFRYMHSLMTHFGIGSETSIQRIEIFWPSGNTDLILNPAINQVLDVIEGETLSLEDSFVNDLILYPNPTKNVLNLNATYGFENALYSVFDIQGRRVLNSYFNSNQIDVSNLSAGTYLLRITQDGQSKTQKFIKQ